PVQRTAEGTEDAPGAGPAAEGTKAADPCWRARRADVRRGGPAATNRSRQGSGAKGFGDGPTTPREERLNNLRRLLIWTGGPGPTSTRCMAYSAAEGPM